jgi:hypothetical protein
MSQNGVFQPFAVVKTLTMLTVAGADPVVDGWEEKREVESATVLCGGFRLAWVASRTPKVRLATSVDDHHKSPI